MMDNELTDAQVAQMNTPDLLVAFFENMGKLQETPDGRQFLADNAEFYARTIAWGRRVLSNSLQTEKRQALKL